jgi:hypothetical protein
MWRGKFGPIFCFSLISRKWPLFLLSGMLSLLPKIYQGRIWVTNVVVLWPQISLRRYNIFSCSSPLFLFKDLIAPGDILCG